MAESPPQLGDLPQYPQMNISALQSDPVGRETAPAANGNASVQNAKDSVYSNASSAFNTVNSHPMTQNLKDTVSQGPVAEHVKDQHAKTTSEFRSLADSRTTPSQSTATGQPLTHYHSFFYSLLSWENPRATTVSFLGTVLFIFAARYLPALRWTFKGLYVLLGITALAEAAGKLVLSQGLSSSFRPKKYYTIPREALEASLEDVEQLINFFVIEFQRVLFVENIVHTTAAFTSALISYWLIKFLPFWGLSLIATSVVYLGPLVYINNKEVIDHHLTNASNVASSQANQVKELAGQQTARATSTVKAYAGDYSAKAQGYIGSARGRSASPEVTTKSFPSTPVKSEPGTAPNYSPSDFPHAPRQEPTPGVTAHQEQYENSQFGGKAEPAI
ncbi:hypothetical protein MMC14_003762 [Varicellaria rhodocarpa]|nr:hypothetical protein [Varicellaria rhodocarpa]